MDITRSTGDLGARAAAVLDSAAHATEVDGAAPLSEQFRLGLHGPGPHLIAMENGVLIGYAGVVIAPGGGASAEVVVDPAARGAGTGTALVRAALAAGGDGTGVWAHGDLPAARAVAARLGLRASRTLLQLRRPLPEAAPTTPSPEAAPTAPSVPAGVTLSTYAGPEDDADLLAVNNAAFAWHPEQGGWSREQITARTGADWFDPAGLFLARDAAGELLGFHWTKVHPATASEAALGEVYILAVAPAGQGRGLGGWLTAVGLEHLANRGLTEVELYVEGDNTAALRTYARTGFTEYSRDVQYVKLA
jgi:mycothiol synthase